jgi:hypothetical protein
MQVARSLNEHGDADGDCNGSGHGSGNGNGDDNSNAVLAFDLILL